MHLWLMHDERQLWRPSLGPWGQFWVAERPVVFNINVAVQRLLTVNCQAAYPKVAAEGGTALLGSAEYKRTLARIILATES